MLDAIIAHTECLSDPEIFDAIFEAREIHEHAIVQLSAARRTEEDITELRKILAKIAQAKDAAQYGETIFKFYHTIALAAHNMVLSLSLQSYKGIYVYMAKTLFPFRQAQESNQLKTMRLLTELIEQQLAEKAVECASQLIQQGVSRNGRTCGKRVDIANFQEGKQTIFPPLRLK